MTPPDTKYQQPTFTPRPVSPPSQNSSPIPSRTAPPPPNIPTASPDPLPKNPVERLPNPVIPAPVFTPKPEPEIQSPTLNRQDAYKEPLRETPKTPSFDSSQKKTFLEREEVHTMQKDVTQLREQQAKKEQERIAQLKAEQETQREKEAVEKIRAEAQRTKQQEESQKRNNLQKIQDSILPPGEEQRFQNIPKKPSPRKKVFVRVLFIIMFAFIALNGVLFTYWFFSKNQSISFQIPFLSSEEEPNNEIPSAPSPAPTPTPTPGPTPTPTPTSTPQPNLVTSLLNSQQTSTLQFSSSEQLTSLLSQLIDEPPQSGFTNILLSKIPENQYITRANEFLTVLRVAIPPGISSHVTNEAGFFSFASPRGNRFGMIIQIQNPESAKTALSAWESQAEQTLEPLLPFWGRPSAGYSATFRSLTHQGVEIRFQTFSTQDYGIVYAIVDNYLILTSSFETMQETIETLQERLSAINIEPQVLATITQTQDSSPPSSLSLEQAIGQILMIGFNDATLTPELEQLMERLRPGGVLLLSRNIQSITQLQKLTQDLQRVSLKYSQLPLFIAVDQEGGSISRVQFGKEKTAQSIIRDTDHAYTVGQKRAQELRLLGINVNLSPVLDNTNPEDFLFDRTFQTEHFQSGTLAKALLDGQKESGILSTLKHFPGYGNIAFNPEQKLATVQEFPDTSSFSLALVSNPEFLLLSNVIYDSFDPDNPFTFSSKGISMVRKDMGFQGIIISDDLAQPSLFNNYDFDHIVFSPIQAGVTMLMFSKQPDATNAHELLAQSIQDNPILKRNIENSAARILEAKKKFFFETDYSVPLDHLSQNK